MTDNNSPSPFVAAASSQDSAPNHAWKVWDNDIGEMGHWGSAYQDGYPQWESIDLGSGNAIDVTSYKVIAGRDEKRIIVQKHGPCKDQTTIQIGLL